MSNILAWNVRGLNRACKQVEVIKLLNHNNVGLFELLETQVREQGLGLFYQKLGNNWCVTSNIG